MITQKDIDKIMEWCSSNDIIEFENSRLKLVLLDGGYCNVIKLKEFLESMKE